MASTFIYVGTTFLLLCSMCDASRRVYETARVTATGTFDCLHDVVVNEVNISPFETNARIRTVRFCRQSISSINRNSSSRDNKTMINGHPITYDRLRETNITAEQLFNWFAPVDMIEDYESGTKIGWFFNCTENDNFWFGPGCEYTFDSMDYFPDLVDKRFENKRDIPADLLSITNGTCYQIGDDDDECQSVLCLDWREICDGKIDCANGFDEYHCHELEMNECDPVTEFRCQNGQCIDKSLYWDLYPDCMDHSDERSISDHYCFDTIDSRCEDKPCPPTWFSCGDGYCYNGPSASLSGPWCASQRDLLYFKQSPPSTLILFSHIFIIYKNTSPQLICFNETLCPYLSNLHTITTNVSDGLTCRAFNTFTNQTYVHFHDMIAAVKRFVHSCSLLPRTRLNDKCTLFECGDKSKCFSRHRLSDGHKDCANGEDEHQANVCDLNLPYRYTCDNKTQCIHQSLVDDHIVHCVDRSDEEGTRYLICDDPHSEECYAHRRERHRFNMSFGQICNSIFERTPDVNNDTDESNCPMSEWSCYTSYTDCNDIWNCFDGRDELFCGHTTLASLHCDSKSHFCLNISNGYPICLPKARAGDSIIDCVGSLDEREFCRIQFPHEANRRYRCRNSNVCISIYEACDCHQNCPENDDETIACDWLNNGEESICDPRQFRCRDGEYLNDDTELFRCDNEFGECSEGEDELFCNMIDKARSRTFITEYIEEIPKLNRQTVRHLSEDTGIVHWYCNRGIYVRSSIDPPGFYCLCTDSYYGDRCQFQRKRLSVILQLRTTSSFDPLLSSFKLIVLLVSNSTTDTIISHEQIIYTPQRHCLPRYFVQLYYPINESFRPLTNHSVYIHAFTAQTLEYRTTWKFPVSFEFLPVNRIAKQLLVPDSLTIPTLLFNHTNCTLCSNVSLCLGYDVVLGQDICVCPSNRTGRRCLVPFNPCTNDSCNEHGTCLPVDSYRHETQHFMCLCDIGWFGDQCDEMKARIHVSFAPEVLLPSSNIAFLHAFAINIYYEPIHFTYFHRLSSEISNYTFYFDNDILHDLIFIQLYEHQNEYEYYLLFASKLSSDGLEAINSEVHPSRRCRSINELFNATILAQPPLRRVKYYQQPCLQRDTKGNLTCFYDDKLMCLCDETNHSNCFNFEPTSFGCAENKCSGRGMCVQDHDICPKNSLCLCDPCSYGSTCQFSRSGYSLSLDSIIGSHIRLTTSNTKRQTKIIQMSVILLILLIIFGIILNVLGIATFCQRVTQDVGSGFYLLVSSCFGLLTSISLILKLIFLFITNQGNVQCSLIEFLLKWCLTSCEYINTCVSIERTIAVKHKAKFSRPRSKRMARWLSIVVLMISALISSPELIFRRIVLDTFDERAWCVLTLNADRPVLLTIYSISNILSFSIPLIINVICSIFILVGTIRLKQKTLKDNTRRTVTVNLFFRTVNMSVISKTGLKNIRSQITRHKHILIAPILLSIFGIPRLVFAFVFVCTKLDQQPFLTLPSYLVGFLPSMATLFVFILPSIVYRTALLAFIKKIVPECIQKYILILRRRS